MCLFKAPKTPTPPPLPPAPPPPLPPVQPTPPPEPTIKDVNPQVRRAKEERKKKGASAYSQGTGSLRIKLDPKVNTGMNTTGGGLN
tara:strand:- start:659 stop:916 length:258 start_codon:yes stop_codon:yes gene_type:complete